jgi:hypothetical protein
MPKTPRSAGSRSALIAALALGGAAVWSYRSLRPASSIADPSAASAGSRPIPALERDASPREPATLEIAPARPSRLQPREDERRALDRPRADRIRRLAAQRRTTEQARAASGTPEDPKAANAGPQPAALTAEEDQRRRDYVQRAVREQYIPVARSCYEELLGRDPKASGTVVMEFAIVGGADAGVVDRVELRDDTTIDDPEFTLCMRESMYSTLFEPPPPGTSETTVVYPFALRP